MMNQISPELTWLISILNSEKQQILKNNFSIRKSDTHTAICCPTIHMLEVASCLQYFGWSYKVQSVRIRKSNTFGTGIVVTDAVKSQIQQTIHTAIDKKYVDEAKTLLNTLDCDEVLNIDCVICSRLDGKLPLRIVRNKQNVYIELVDSSI